jgi:hypothetical protein
VSDIFREEALAELRSRGGPGDVLRAGPSWLAWSFALLLVLVTLESDGRSVRAVLPLALQGDVRPGATIRLDFAGTRRTARITRVKVAPDGLTARTRLVSPLPDQVPRSGRASVKVGSDTLFDLLGG